MVENLESILVLIVEMNHDQKFDQEECNNDAHHPPDRILNYQNRMLLMMNMFLFLELFQD
jgi:hypothetical protein